MLEKLCQHKVYYLLSFNPMTLTACAMRVSWENSILVLGSNSMQKCHELGAAESKWGIGRK